MKIKVTYCVRRILKLQLKCCGVDIEVIIPLKFPEMNCPIGPYSVIFT